MSIIKKMLIELDALTAHANTPEEMEQTLKTTVYEWLKNQRMACMEEKEAIAHGDYIAYRAQRALYLLSVREHPEEALSWEKFVLAMRISEDLRNAATAVILHAICTFPCSNHFDFKAQESNPFNEAEEPVDENGMIQSARLYTPETGAAIIGLFTLIAEDIYYNIYRSGEGRANNTWEEYVDDLQSDPELWHPLEMAIREALTRMDFEKSWKSEEARKAELLRGQDPSAE